MNPEYWISRWERGETGFHAEHVQEGLKKAAENLPPLSGKRVLVPLCGKSVDMHWLMQQGAFVIGIDLSRKACESFFETHGIPFTESEQPGFRIFEGGSITLIAGDFFAVTRRMCGAADIVYDRAALVALPPEMRGRYVRHLQRLAGPAPVALITFEYDSAERIGPPFQVPVTEVSGLFGPGYEYQEILRKTLETGAGSKLHRNGVHQLEEITLLIHPDVKIP